MKFTLDVNVSCTSDMILMKQVALTDTGSGQGIEIIL